jgi:hypothetical protein
LLHAIFGDGKLRRIRIQAKFELPGTPFRRALYFQFFLVRIRFEIFWRSYGNRKICIVRGKAWIDPCDLWSAQVLHPGDAWQSGRKDSKRHDLVFKVHPNAFGQIAV